MNVLWIAENDLLSFSFSFQVWEVDLAKKQEGSGGGGRVDGSLPCSEACAGNSSNCAAAAGFPTTTCLWLVCSVFLRFTSEGYRAPMFSQAGGSRGHPKANRKHPRAHSSQGLQATVLTRASAYVHQTLEGYRGSLRQNAGSVGVTIQLVMRRTAETTMQDHVKLMQTVQAG